MFKLHQHLTRTNTPYFLAFLLVAIILCPISFIYYGSKEAIREIKFCMRNGFGIKDAWEQHKEQKAYYRSLKNKDTTNDH